MRKKVDTLQLVVTKNTVYMVYSVLDMIRQLGCLLSSLVVPYAIIASVEQFGGCFPADQPLISGAQEVLNILKKTRLLVREERRPNVNI